MAKSGQSPIRQSPFAMLPFSPIDVLTRNGTRLRAAVFEAKSPRALCVVMSGQTEFIEKYVEVIGELNDRGYTVATFDWRGQGGSARLLDDPLKVHVRDFADYDDDLSSFLDQIVKPISTSPPLVLAHSMGAHILLRMLRDKPGAFAAAVLSAPMLAVSTRGYPPWVARIVPAAYGALGRSNDYAWGMAKTDPFLIDFTTQICTTDARRFERTQAILKANPSLRLAGPTWGWIAAAYRSMSVVSAPGYAEAVATPTLIAAAGRDRVVLVEAERQYARRLPSCTYVELDDSEHEILMEVDSIRGRFWQAFDHFAEQHLS
jgi:lysophospholipase